MKPQIYPFSQFPNADGSILYRPYVPICIVHPADNKIIFNTSALIDTGADRCTFPKINADRMGYDLKAPGVPTSSSRGIHVSPVQFWTHPYKIFLYSPDRKEIVWKSGTIEVACFDHNQVPSILGFSDFMCHFIVNFNHTTKRITIQKPL